MNPQLNFIISSEKECELFDYITHKLDGVILRMESATTFAQQAETDKIFSSKYLITSEILYKKNHKVKKELYEVLLFDDKMNFSPYIEYERFENIFRIYMNYSAIGFQEKKLLRPLYDNIVKWIRANAKTKQKSGIMAVFIIE